MILSRKIDRFSAKSNKKTPVSRVDDFGGWSNVFLRPELWIKFAEESSVLRSEEQTRVDGILANRSFVFRFVVDESARDVLAEATVVARKEEKCVPQIINRAEHPYHAVGIQGTDDKIAA